MKKLSILLLTTMLVFICSCCSHTNTSNSDSDIYLNVEDEASTTASLSNAENSASSDHLSNKNNVTINSTIAFAYESSSGTNVYGAAEYTNNGLTPIIVYNAHFSFIGTNQTEEKDFVPVFSESCIVNPGETSYVVLWVENSTFTPDEYLSLNVELTVGSPITEHISLSVKDLFLADNYPGFTTLYGKLYSSDSVSCSLNIVYVGFYGKDNTFLGAWYFTKNALLELGDCKSFVEHMRALPLDKLSSNCLQMKSIAFGIK